MEFVFDDGGRSEVGYKGLTGECVTRSIAIVTGKPYQEVYDALNELGRSERTGKRKKRKSNSRTGVYKQSYRRYLESLGWVLDLDHGAWIRLQYTCARGSFPRGASRSRSQDI
jgi:hypothetical protein